MPLRPKRLAKRRLRNVDDSHTTIGRYIVVRPDAAMPMLSAVGRFSAQGVRFCRSTIEPGAEPTRGRWFSLGRRSVTNCSVPVLRYSRSLEYAWAAYLEDRPGRHGTDW